MRSKNIPKPGFAGPTQPDRPGYPGDRDEGRSIIDKTSACPWSTASLPSEVTFRKKTVILSASICAALTGNPAQPKAPILTRLRGRVTPPVDVPSHYWAFSTYTFHRRCEFTHEHCICRFADLFYLHLENES